MCGLVLPQVLLARSTERCVRPNVHNKKTRTVLTPINTSAQSLVASSLAASLWLVTRVLVPVDKWRQRRTVGSGQEVRGQPAALRGSQPTASEGASSG